jgi:hypothetical protein
MPHDLELSPDWSRVAEGVRHSLVRVDIPQEDGSTRSLTGFCQSSGQVVMLTNVGNVRTWTDLSRLLVADDQRTYRGEVCFLATTAEHPTTLVRVEGLEGRPLAHAPRPSAALRPHEPLLSLAATPRGLEAALGTLEDCVPDSRDGSDCSRMVLICSFLGKQPPVGAALFDQAGAFVGLALGPWNDRVSGAVPAEFVFEL